MPAETELSGMEFPRATSVDGAYSYFLALLLLVALLFTVYVAALYFGAAPDPTQLPFAR